MENEEIKIKPHIVFLTAKVPFTFWTKFNEFFKTNITHVTKSEIVMEALEVYMKNYIDKQKPKE